LQHTPITVQKWQQPIKNKKSAFISGFTVNSG